MTEVTNTRGRRHARVVRAVVGMDHRYTARAAPPGETLSVHIENRRAGKLEFDATLALSRRELTVRSLASVTARYPLATGRVLALIYGRALGLALAGVPVQPHPNGGRA